MTSAPKPPQEVRIDRVLVFRESGTVGVALTHPDKKFVIFVGQVEGAAIDRELRKVRSDRPMTHDLLEYALRGFDIAIARVVISSVSNGVYCASIILTQQMPEHRNEVRLDARASDAMVLALKFEVPLFVTSEVLDAVEDFGEQLALLDDENEEEDDEDEDDDVDDLGDDIDEDEEGEGDEEDGEADDDAPSKS
jgi:bifunctional DNase/RNase